MKILAIRGANLASLEAPFALELDRDPLARAGLFAITGPTGAGKSTLLDALCLALFDRTPRLGERGGARIGAEHDDDRLTATDVRGILRRGASSGFAEVDFLGRGRQRLRARWEVRRARDRATGRVQTQSLSLREVDSGRELGGTRTETLQAIERELGLTFEQFRRSVVLAQNEFAAFLRAKPPERAELLERMTDTAIYGELSIAAHGRAGETNAAIVLLERQLAGIAVLDAGAREALDAQCRDAEARLASVQHALELATEATKLADECTRHELDLTAAQRDATDASDTAEIARCALDEHDAGLAERTAALDAARACDLHLGLARSRAEGAVRSAAAATLELAAAERACTRGTIDAAFPASWKDLARELQRAAALRRDLGEAGAQVANARDARIEAQRAFDVVSAELEKQAAALAKFAADAPVKSSLVEYAARREALEHERSALVVLREEHARATAAAERDAEDAKARAAEAEEARTAAELVAQRAALDALRARADLAAHRAHLVDGEPCPLCGAREHPFADADEVPDAQRGILERTLADLDRAQKQAARRATAAAERARSAQERAQAPRGAVKAGKAARATLAHRGPPSPIDAAWLDAIAARTTEELAAARAAERAEQQRIEGAEARRTERDAVHARWLQARADVDGGKHDLAARDARIESLVKALDGLQRDESAAREALAEMLAAKREALAALRADAQAAEDEATNASAERRSLLGGRSVAEAERAWRDERASFELHLRDATTAHAQRSAAATASAKALGETSARRAEVQARLATTGSATIAERDTARAARDALHVQRGVDDRARDQCTSLARHLEAKRTAAGPRLALGQLIGSADGNKFRAFAQGLSFARLLALANGHLQELTPRYALMRVPGEHLELQVVDRELGDEIRAVNGLSGGETFLVSLALALGLASMSARDVAFETLFIDEGLGSLDPQSLESVLTALDALQATGYQVGVISHVEGLAERTGTRVEVVPQGGGRSALRVVGETAALPPGGAVAEMALGGE